MDLLELPDCMLEEIFLRLSYDEIAKKRLVSKRINEICQSLLNRGVPKIISRLQNRIDKLKPLLPRKESERWNHTVNKEINCLESFACSLRQLSSIYKDFIEANLCWSYDLRPTDFERIFVDSLKEIVDFTKSVLMTCFLSRLINQSWALASMGP